MRADEPMLVKKVCWGCRLVKPLSEAGLCPTCQEAWTDPTAIEPPPEAKVDYATPADACR